MNQTQRKFLIERIQNKTKEKIKVLETTKLPLPNKSNYLFKEVLQGTLKLKTQDEIQEALKQKALSAVEGENWLSNERMGYYKERTVTLSIESLIVLPETLLEKIREVNLHNQKVEETIESLKIQLESIEVRIQLASDKTLRSLINEVDDMGDLKLIDTAVKKLN